MRYSINRHNKHSNLIYFSIVNVKHPHISLYGDDDDSDNIDGLTM